jgi:hypothetical protein
MEKALQNEVRDASQKVANRFASVVNARGDTPLARAVASSVKARRDRLPVVAMGTGKLSSGTPIRDVMFGAEFGGGARDTTHQFAPFTKAGYFLYPTVREIGRDTAIEWFDAVTDVVARYWHN